MDAQEISVERGFRYFALGLGDYCVWCRNFRIAEVFVYV